MYSCIAYGVCIHSDIPLPDLPDTNAAPDVIVRLVQVDCVPAQGAIVGPGWWATAKEICLYYEELGAVLLRGGREMLVDPLPGLDRQALLGLILGAPLALLLHQRGLLVLHASAVDLGGAAVAFLGDVGWGKSTAAMALHVRGHGVVADDIVALALGAEGRPMALPAFPRLKLSPKVVAALDQDPAVLPRVHPDRDKRAFRVTEGFPRAPVPLECIYVLGAGTCLELETLASQEAFLQLVRHSVAVHLLEATGASSRHFQQCAQVVKHVSICRLKRQQTLDSLPDMAQMIEAHLVDRPARPNIFS